MTRTPLFTRGMPKAQRLDDLRLGEVSGVDHPAHLEEGWMVMKAVGDSLPPEVAEVLAAAADAVSEHEEEPVGDLTAPATKAVDPAAGEDDTEAVLKSLPEPVRKRFEAMESEIAKGRENQEQAEAVAKCADWSHIPGITAEFATDLRKARGGDPEAVGKLEAALDAANKALAESALFKSIGAATRGEVGGTSAQGRLEALAKARASENNEPYATALDRVLETPEGHALYQEHQRDKREVAR
jgi:hypothetical protein